MANCSVTQINAANGNPSQLYKDLLAHHDQDEAVRLYLAAHSMTGAYSPETTDGNGELKADYLLGLISSQSRSFNALNKETNLDPTRYRSIEDYLTMRIRSLHGRESDLRGQSTDNFKEIAANRSQREKKEQELKEVKLMTMGAQIIKFANSNIAEVERLVNNPSVSMKDVEFAHDTVRLWEGSMKNGVFTSSEIQAMKSLSPELEFHLAKVAALKNQLSTMTRTMVTKIIKDSLGHNLTAQEIFMIAHDIGFLKKHGLDVSRINNPIAQAGWKLYLDATHRTRIETTSLREHLDGLLTKVSRQLVRKGGYMAFYGKTAKGYMTGDMISRNTYEYEQDRIESRNSAIRGNAASDWESYGEWNRANSYQLDPRAAGADPSIQDHGAVMTDTEIAAHRAFVEKKLGKKEADKQFTEAASKVARYEMKKAGALSNLDNQWEHRRNEVLSDIKDPAEYARRSKEFEDWIEGDKKDWIKDNSPFALNSYMGKEKGLKMPRHAEENTMMIAGKDEHYDPRFKEMMSHPDQAELYEHMIDVHKQLTDMMPSDTQDQVRRYGLPALKKSKWEIFKDHPYQIASIMDPFREAAGVAGQQQVSTTPRGPEGEDLRHLKSSLVADHSVAIKDILVKNRLEFEHINKRQPTKLEYREMREKATDALVRAGSLDLGEVLGHMIDTAVAYKYKSRIEDTMKVLDRAMKDEIRGYAANKGGEILKDNFGNPIEQKDGLENIQASYEHFMDKFYGDPKPVEGKAKEKWGVLMTGHERSLKRDLLSLRESIQADTTLSDAVKLSKVQTIDDQIEKLGSYLSASRVGDMLMKYQIYKSLAWNPFSAVSNVLQGMYTNLVEGSAGTHYTNEELMRAFTLTGHSVAAFWTGGKLQTDTATKIRMLVEMFGLEAVSHGELGEVAGGASWMSKFKSLNAMNMQGRSEYLNQAPMLIAMMMHKKITIDGVEHSVWDSFDNQGKWKFGENTEWNGDNNDMSHNKELVNFEASLKNVLKANHGNYDSLNSPLMGKEKFAGRALMMFRTWIFDMANNRASNEWRDFTDSSGIQTKKGFYRSVPDYYRANGGMLGTMTDVLGQLTRKLTFQGTTFDGKIGAKFTSTDAANMRRVFTEASTFMTVTAAYYAIKALMPDDTPSSKAARNLGLNTILRLQTDINFFVNPMSIQALNKNIVPITSIVNDLAKMFTDLNKAINGHGMTTTGPGKGGYPLLYDLLGMIPGAHQANNIRANLNLMDGSTSKGH